MLLLRRALASPVLLLAAGLAFPDEPPGADDPLPKGAKARLGSARMAIDRAVLLPPDYRAFAVPSSEGVWRYDAATGRRLDAKAAAEGVVRGPVTVSADGRRAVSLSTPDHPILISVVATGRTVWLSPADAPGENEPPTRTGGIRPCPRTGR
jgi:hypothetical protein